MKIFAVAALSALVFSLPVLAEDAATKPAEKDYVILKVGDEPVKKSEVNEVWESIFPGGNPPPFDTFDKKIKDNVLRGVASEHILYKEAEKTGVQNSEDVKARIQAATRQIVIQEFLKIKTKDLVSDDKLKAAYDAQVKEEATKGEDEVHARHILVKTEEEAKQIERKLKKGANFEKLAQDKSQDKTSGAAGGDLGWFTADKMVPEFSKAAFALKVGQISDPVKTDFGWHIIKVEERRKSTPPAFDQVKDQMRQDMGNKAVGDYVKDLMKNVKLTELDADGHEKDLPSAPDAAPAAAPAATPAPAAAPATAPAPDKK